MFAEHEVAQDGDAGRVGEAVEEARCHVESRHPAYSMIDPDIRCHRHMAMIAASSPGVNSQAQPSGHQREAFCVNCRVGPWLVVGPCIAVTELVLGSV
jgi:hypothetical protein